MSSEDLWTFSDGAVLDIPERAVTQPKAPTFSFKTIPEKEELSTTNTFIQPNL